MSFGTKCRSSPIRVVSISADDRLLDLAINYDVAVYDASYLSLALRRNLPLATVDRKLQHAAERSGIEVISP